MMSDALRRSIETLSGSEARDLLLNTMIRINRLKKESTESQEQKMNHLYAMYDQVISYHQPSQLFERDFEVVHIVCGESTAGALRVGLGRKNLVIGFPDFFATGPLWELHNEEGRKYRYEWLRDHIQFPDRYIEEEYQTRITNTLEKMKAIPENRPIVIWTAENPNEQTGIRYLFQLLKEKPNKIHLINGTLAYQELSNTNQDMEVCNHTADLHPEKLKLIYKNKMGHPLSEDDKRRLQDEWEAIANTKEVLRIWDGRGIRSVSEDYFDQHIISTVQRLHINQGEKEFIRTARIIGDTLFKVDRKVDDLFLEYRIRALVYKGVFEIKGIPKGMKNYGVKLRD